MKIFIICAIVGLVVADRPPPSSYSAPNGGFGGNGGFGDGPSSGYSGPSNGRNGGFGGGSTRGSNGGYGADPAIEALGESIPGGGIPGEDFPILSEVPETGFACEDIPFPGYFADTDPEAGCQVFHICQARIGSIHKDSFLCPNGTIFNQQYLVCDWWFNFDCATAEDFYAVNEAIGQEPDPYGSSQTQTGYNGNGGNGGRKGGRKNGNGGRSSGSNGASGNGNQYSSNGAGQNGNGNSYSGSDANQNAPSSSYGAPSDISSQYSAPF